MKTRFPLIPLVRTLVLLFSLFTISCSRYVDISHVMLHNTRNFYYIDFANYPDTDATLPIGVFDSGTGGLSVLADLVTHPGLAEESFIYHGDLANMPYGSYTVESNTTLLVEHVMKDVQFLMGNKYYQRADSSTFMSDKRPVKAVVIACNTATAFGLEAVREFIHKAEIDIGVIGVIEAGVKGALHDLPATAQGGIAIMATDATVKSLAYPKEIETWVSRNNFSGSLQVYQQAGVGIAEAVDESPDAINRAATAPRAGYRGPSDTAEGELKIRQELWSLYNFDTDNGALLFEGELQNPRNIQLNSVKNYIAFHVVTLLEKIRTTENAMPLHSLILACTHYPFHESTFQSEFQRLRMVERNGVYPYRNLISAELKIINPAAMVAQQLHAYLGQRKMLNPAKSGGDEFWVSVPNLTNPNIQLREDSSFTYEYKYGRMPGEIQEYIRVVPFSLSTIPEDILTRLALQTPHIYARIVNFNHANPMTGFLKPEERIPSRTP